MDKKRIFTSLIALVLVCLAAGLPVAASQTPSGIPFDTMADRIDSYVQTYVGRSAPGVAVVVFSQGEIIFSRGYGYADLENLVSVHSDDTVFEYGSISKLFVYTTLMQLAEQGRLDLTDDVRTYLPDSLQKTLQRLEPFSFIHIMNHQAGFEDMLLDTVITDPVHRTDFLELLRMRQPKQVYRPGTVAAYSNFAVALAAAAAQNILKQEFHAYLQDSVFDPLGMTSTVAQPDLLDRTGLAGRRARGYVPDAQSGSFQEIGWSYIPLYPVGAVSGTAEDLARFAMALMPPPGQRSVLFHHDGTLDELFSQTMAMGPGLTGFAHGFIEHDGILRGVGHGGNTAGFSAQMNLVPEQRFGVIVLTNAAGEMDLTEGITRQLLGYGKQAQDVPPSSDLPDTATLDGDYLSARRPHDGFLKLYGFLNQLQVRSAGEQQIQVSFAGQTADYRQIQPYVYEQTTASGPFFQYQFKKIYFEVTDGSVIRVSGDFLPVPTGYSAPWLWTDIIITILAAVFFVLLPVILLSAWFRHWKLRRKGTGSDRQPWPLPVMITCGMLLLANNGLLVWRMLSDNYRAYAEVQWQLVLNYPLALTGLAAAFAAVTVLTRKLPKTGNRASGRTMLITVPMLAALLYVLVKWGFISMI